MNPKSIQLSQDPKGIAIEWDDGHKGIYPFPYLRKACPCALCKGERMPLSVDSERASPGSDSFRPGERSERSVHGSPMGVSGGEQDLTLTPKDMFKVGRYAIGFRWGDGHDTGIYTFDYLRKYCPCEACLTN